MFYPLYVTNKVKCFSFKTRSVIERTRDWIIYSVVAIIATLYGC